MRLFYKQICQYTYDWAFFDELIVMSKFFRQFQTIKSKREFDFLKGGPSWPFNYFSRAPLNLSRQKASFKYPYDNILDRDLFDQKLAKFVEPQKFYHLRLDLLILLRSFLSLNEKFISPPGKVGRMNLIMLYMISKKLYAKMAQFLQKIRKTIKIRAYFRVL